MSELIVMKKRIESLNLTRQREILRILVDNNTSISENKNGSFINLTILTDKVVADIKKYLQYITDQDETIAELESVKQEFECNYFDKDNKEKNENKSKSSDVVVSVQAM
tara:strand:- start:445 stop:771 length:327 start_codon:yes stop_codon:yes gene_type:complete